MSLWPYHYAPMTLSQVLDEMESHNIDVDMVSRHTMLREHLRIYLRNCLRKALSGVAGQSGSGARYGIVWYGVWFGMVW